jgi:hypothetical protein
MKPYPRPIYPVSKSQIKTIKMLCRQLAIDRDAEHDMLEERYRVRSCTLLNFSQAGHFIKELESKGGTIIQISKPAKQQHPRPQRRSAPNHGLNTARPVSRDNDKVICMVTPEEIDKINQVAALIIWRVEGGLQAFLEKRMGIKGGRVKTSAEAYLAIEGLKKLFENFMKRQHGKDWWMVKFENPAIMEYIDIHKPAEYR